MEQLGSGSRCCGRAIAQDVDVLDRISKEKTPGSRRITILHQWRAFRVWFFRGQLARSFGIGGSFLAFS